VHHGVDPAHGAQHRRQARLGGTVRAFLREVMALVKSAMQRVAESTAAAFGARAELDFRELFAPTVNHPQEAAYAAMICAALVGADRVEHDPPLIMASEDFSFMLERVPGCFLNIDNGGADGSCEVHNPADDFNDEALPRGAAFFTRLVERRLQPLSRPAGKGLR